MKKIQFPAAFVIGSGILKTFFQETAHFGSSYAFIGSKTALSVLKEALGEAVDGKDLAFVLASGIPSYAELERVRQLPEVERAQIICGVGGGGVLDIARAVAINSGRPLINIPTAVASDAAGTWVSVFYAEDGAGIVGDKVYHRAADLIYLDSSLVAQASTRLFAAGLGDAYATLTEARACYNHPEMNGTMHIAMKLCEACEEIVERYGLAAYRAVENNVVTPQLEHVLEATCFLSGVGGMNVGCAAAHGIGDFLSTLPEGHAFMHGERVYVGLIIQMILEEWDDAVIRERIRFGQAVGLPVCLADLKIPDVEKIAYRIAEDLQDDHFMKHLCVSYETDLLAGAFITACAMAKEEKKE